MFTISVIQHTHTHTHTHTHIYIYIYIYIYIKYIICKQILWVTFLNEHEVICLHTVKLFHELQCYCQKLTPVICLHT